MVCGTARWKGSADKGGVNKDWIGFRPDEFEFCGVANGTGEANTFCDVCLLI